MFPIFWLFISTIWGKISPLSKADQACFDRIVKKKTLEKFYKYRSFDWKSGKYKNTVTISFKENYFLTS
jgi:hypothetical protein